MNDPALFWTKVSALGQVAGALATFLAVWVALYLGRSERRFNLRVTARFAVIVNRGGSTPVLSIEVENIGFRTATITGFGWTTGYRNILGLIPKAFRYKSAFQMPDYEWAINPDFPWKLEPGETRATHMRRDEFIEGFAQPSPDDLFRQFPWQKRPKLFRHRVCVSVTTMPRAYFGSVEDKVTKSLNDGYRG